MRAPTYKLCSAVSGQRPSCARDSSKCKIPLRARCRVPHCPLREGREVRGHQLLHNLGKLPLPVCWHALGHAAPAAMVGCQVPSSPCWWCTRWLAAQAGDGIMDSSQSIPWPGSGVRQSNLLLHMSPQGTGYGRACCSKIEQNTPLEAIVGTKVNVPCFRGFQWTSPSLPCTITQLCFHPATLASQNYLVRPRIKLRLVSKYLRTTVSWLINGCDFCASYAPRESHLLRAMMIAEKTIASQHARKW